MGSYDGAESCELVGCYILSQIKENHGNELQFGLYRDDGLAVSYKSPREIEQQKKALCAIFQSNGLKIKVEANKKVIDFLDVTLDLYKGEHRPFMKAGNKPQYIHVKSNHPPSVLKAVPEGINKRLSQISSSERIFREAIPPYQEALNESGFKYKLRYMNVNNDSENTAKSKNRSRKITWFNPPYDLTVKTNIGRNFFKIMNECFPESHVLRKIFNKNTLKISYSCMPNVKNSIDGHNAKQLRKEPAPERTCNCRRPADCPLNGNCLQKSIVYQATITAASKPTETYIGLTETTFKTRFGNHKQSFIKENLKNSTELSKHIWKLKRENMDYKITWKIVGRASPYNGISKRCNLCTLEKFYIIYKREMATLNKKSELINTCRHRNKFLLKNR